MILGLGTDACAIKRFEKILENPRFLERWFTAAERDYLAGRRAESAAGLFAAKEAASKALGSGFSHFGPDSVEILHDAQGRPRCRLHGAALERLEALGGAEILVSITHDGGLALAVALAVSAEPAAKVPRQE